MNSAIVQKVLAGETGILQQRFSYVSGTSNVEYIGKSLAGVADDATGWQIIKLTYNGSNVTDINFASNNSNFEFIWDSRTTYFV